MSISNGAKEDFLALLVDSSALARVLRVFIFDQSSVFTLQQIAKRGGVSLAMAKLEVSVLTKLGIIKGRTILMVQDTADTTQKKKSTKKHVRKNQKVWFVDPGFKHLRALSAFVHEVSPAQYDVVLDALKRTGRLGVVILSGTFLGDTSRPVDLLVAAESFSEARLDMAVRKLEPLFGREIRYAAFSTPEFRYRLTIQDRLIRDTLDYPHTVLLDRGHLL
ncbi:hypothetical protein FJY93_03825 [Candidatus Kaiserbacteria bacterium]|nr:hypothetical protein [Candidatus Kaiserbacteria bacterium]